jgi:hypothetical protein
MVAAGVSPHVIAEQLGHLDAGLPCSVTATFIQGASRQAALDPDLYLEAACVGHTWGAGGSLMNLPKAPEIDMEPTGIEPVTSDLQSRRSPTKRTQEQPVLVPQSRHV